MDAFETFTTVAQGGAIHVAGVPFPPGMEVEVIVAPRRSAPQDFQSTWASVCAELRSAAAGQLSGADVDAEIQAYRRGE